MFRDEPAAHTDTFYLLFKFFKNTKFIFIFSCYKKKYPGKNTRG